MFRSDPRCVIPCMPGRAEGDEGSGVALGDAPAPGATRMGGTAVREEGPSGAEKAERDIVAIMSMSIRSIP